MQFSSYISIPAKYKLNYTASENDVNRTLSYFAVFDCFAINALLSKPRELDGPKYLQYAYPTVNLFTFRYTKFRGYLSVRETQALH